ncbi:MAG: phenylalanine--tRNA ligase subunit alpha [Clostridiales Family XIII bacterium]|jgi:phenylalanyl-tRNA synthetase alpha chain|nr:phenylalanine--tRNA ligase subunit alpha [Clostridiales Family XIII bacterium]
MSESKTVEAILAEARGAVASSADATEVEALRIKYLGKKGEITAILKTMGSLAPEERKELGQVVNKAKSEVEALIEEKKTQIENASKNSRLAAERIDVTEPGIEIPAGTRHMITQTIDEIVSIFSDIGYSVTEGPEVETVFNNFDALNAAPNHPSRDMTDTFYITDDVLLRTQTSPVQVRTILTNQPPLKVISPGRCFRADTPDATHSPMFHQVEGLLVDEGVTMADLKGTLDLFAKRMFGEDVQTKFRPHFFPFTEPSAEMDMSCFKCGGAGCRVCKGSGWIEILGCGMVHPNVLSVGGIDTDKYTGFAFGMGVERIAMLKHGISDIRLFYENDIRFIEQFY